MELKCPKKYPKLIEYKKEYIKYDIKNIIDNLETNLKNKSQAISKFEEIEYYNEILQIAEEYFKSEYYDTSKLDNGQEEKIESEKLKITFTTIENEKNKININTTVIDIGECETLLREYYNISKDEKLYLKKIDIIQEGMKTSKIGYDVYYNLFGQNLVKLNLTSCENTKISIFIPISINEPIDKLNSSSGYYNDICYTTTSEDGTDITLDDRKKDFIDKNKAICQEDCQFSKYDEIKKIAKCSCNVKESSSFIDDISFNKEKLLKNFKDIKNFLNFNFLVCYRNLFNVNGIKNNVGFYIIFVIIIFHILSVFILFINQFPLLKKKISELIFLKMDFAGIKEKENKIKKTKKKKGGLKKKEN